MIQTIKIKWNDEHIQYIKELQDKGLSSEKAIKVFNKHFGSDTSARYLRKKAYENGIPFENHGRKPKSVSSRTKKQTQSWNADGVQTSETIIKVIKGQKMSDEDLLKAHGYDPEKFILANAISNFWKSTPEATLFQTKISIKPKNEVSANEYVDIFNSKIEPLQVNLMREGRHSLVVPLFDLHFGIMTFELYREKLAEIEEIMSRGFKHIVIEQGGDIFHSDFINKTQTVKGTQLDHVNMVKAVKDAKHFYDEIMQCALANAPKVDVYSVGGNHDFDMAYMFTDALADRYPQADVHNTTEYRDAYSLDKVGILLGHGDKAQKKLPMLFATEYPLIWSQSVYREVHYGHFHREVTNDDYGVVTRQIGTPKLTDPYEKANGYTMATHKLQLFEYGIDRLKATYEI
ncbi:MAG: helix-turn-helix domain-containing protein [Liquorilactobacillus satsumensis]|uniref:helix-turn-helix domain-containing protein n=1 Tax=Liquorilactobacillus satsumensis TaxID=259059 RepID=UPI0039E72D42